MPFKRVRVRLVMMAVVVAPAVGWAAPFTEGLNVAVETFSGIHGSYTHQDHAAATVAIMGLTCLMGRRRRAA